MDAKDGVDFHVAGINDNGNLTTSTHDGYGNGGFDY
jgi:hypothetical protein